jgi:hypothetical protein
MAREGSIMIGKPGPMTIALLWAVISLGLASGVTQGYNADTRAETEFEYDTDTKTLTIGNNSSVMYGPDAEIEESEPPLNESELLSERGERWFGPPKDGDSSDRLGQGEPVVDVDGPPGRALEAVEDGYVATINQTIDTGLEIIADVGDWSATVAYQHRDHVAEEVAHAIVSIVVFSPALGWAAARYGRKGDRS